MLTHINSYTCWIAGEIIYASYLLLKNIMITEKLNYID